MCYDFLATYTTQIFQAEAQSPGQNPLNNIRINMINCLAIELATVGNRGDDVVFGLVVSIQNSVDHGKQ